MIQPRSLIKRAIAAMAVATFLLVAVPRVHAACSVGTTLGACPGLSVQGCCADPSVVQWCESGEWCQIDCSQNAGTGDECIYNPIASCCQRCGVYDAAVTCQCDEICSFYGDCCEDYGPLCLVVQATVCGWSDTLTFSGYDCSTAKASEPTETYPYDCDPGGVTTCTCLGQQCGDDGCGNSCGTCPAGWVCDGTGLCQCLGSCLGKQCGDDGCGNSCGECPVGDFCVSGVCQSSCIPDCSGKSCGLDGCGDVCGMCSDGDVCSPSGVCESGCQPSCTGKQCGDDGCGGVCGVCPDGSSCDASGICAPDGCSADCTGKVCGNDGCGGACGTCAGGELCNALGQCDAACTSDCAGKQCGHDGCGGSCGTCPAGSCQEYLCVMGCIASCGTAVCGDDGCGGSCGGCAPGQTCDVAGQCSAGCVPDCAGRQCGSDGCGGSCGLCGVGTYCSPLGSCLVPDNDEVVPTGPTSGCPEDTYWHSLVQECTADDGSHIPVNREPEVTTGCGGSPAPASSWLGLLCLLLVLRPRRQTIP